MRKSELQPSRSLIEEISSFTTSDVVKIQDEVVLRYVAKFSRNPASRKRAVFELVRMESAEVLEYVATTANSEDTKIIAVKGLSKLSELESLKRLANSGDEKIIPHACRGLFCNFQRIVRELDTESLELLSKFSKKGRERKEASKWLKKLLVVKMIKKIEA